MSSVREYFLGLLLPIPASGFSEEKSALSQKGFNRSINQVQGQKRYYSTCTRQLPFLQMYERRWGIVGVFKLLKAQTEGLRPPGQKASAS
jgi:hypothetical protein